MSRSNEESDICGLDCRKKTKRDRAADYPQILDIKGPVRVVLVDPPDEADSEKRRTTAGLISVANMMIAANTIIVVLFSLSYSFDKVINYHIVLCTVGYQFCLPLSILIVHPLYGPARPMDESRRVWEHFKIFILGMICMGSGFYYATQYKGPEKDSLWAKIAEQFPINKYHNMVGLAASWCFVPVILIGIALPILKKLIDEPIHPKLPTPYSFILYCHRYLGMLALLLCNACFIMGIISPRMQILMYFHSYLTPTIAILFCTLFYTAIIMFFPGWHYTE